MTTRFLQGALNLLSAAAFAVAVVQYCSAEPAKAAFYMAFACGLRILMNEVK